MAARFSVQGFPTIVYFQFGKKNDGKAKQYKGARESNAIVDFGNKLADKAKVEPGIIELYNQNKYDDNC